MPPMEAMACRLAVVTTNVGAVPDYTIPGKTALVSPPRDIKKMAQNIIKLIENKDLREEIAQNGCDYIKQFTWGKATEQLEEVFKKYIKSEGQF
jgi:glycosyltransferase involved in cell wall biosynthesis